MGSPDLQRQAYGLRQKICQALLEKQEEMEPFVTGSFEAYVGNMMLEGTWGGRPSSHPVSWMPGFLPHLALGPQVAVAPWSGAAVCTPATAITTAGLVWVGRWWQSFTLIWVM